MRRPLRSRVRRRSRPRWWMIPIAVALFAFAVWLAIGVVAAERLTVPARRFDASLHPAAFGAVNVHDLRLTTRDGVDVAAWHLDVPGSDAAVILVHGHEASRTWEFQQRFPELAATLQANGYHVLMLDLRAHGESGGERFTFGLRERHEVIAAVDHLVAQGVPAGQVGVLGVSMGGATAIGAAADDPRIGALWSDSSYADIRPVLASRWPAASGLPMIFLHGTLLAHRLRYGLDLADARPARDLPRVAPRPTVLVHGTADTNIPVDHALQLAQVAPWAELRTIPGAEHARAYDADPDAYAAQVIEFFDVALRQKVAALR